MKEDKYLKRIMNVLPIRIKMMINKNDREESIFADTLEEFFRWYMNEKRICRLMDVQIVPINAGIFNITDIDYELIDIGSMLTYTLTHKEDSDIKVIYILKISKGGYIRVIRKSTRDDFHKKYWIKILGEFSYITKDIDDCLFESLKDMMYDTLLAKLDLVYSSNYKKEDIYEAIPCWLK